MAKCTTCESTVENKDNAGRYRNKCAECIAAAARGANKHVHVCEREDCGVCRSWRREREEQARCRLTVEDRRKTLARKSRRPEQTTL